MNRREFLTKVIPAAVIGSTVGCSNKESSPAANAEGPEIHWRLASSFPRSLDIIYGAAETMSKYVAAMTGNKFQIRIYPGGEIVPALQVLDAVQNGTVAMGHTASYYYTGKNSALAFDTSVPFGLTARQQNAWLSAGGGLELINEVLSDFNIRSFPGGNTGVQMGGWFRNEIKTVNDLKGLKMRIPGVGGQVMSRLGVSVQLLAGGDIYPALERGAIDATEWVGPYDDEKLGFFRVAKNYYYPGFWEPGSEMNFFVNKDEWAKLPSNYQAILEAGMAAANLWMTTQFDAKNPPALKRMLDKGVKLRRFSDEILAAGRKATEEYMNEESAKNPAYKKVYESWKKFRDEQQKWFATSELAYLSFVSPQS